MLNRIIVFFTFFISICSANGQTACEVYSNILVGMNKMRANMMDTIQNQEYYEQYKFHIVTTHSRLSKDQILVFAQPKYLNKLKRKSLSPWDSLEKTVACQYENSLVYVNVASKQIDIPVHNEISEENRINYINVVVEFSEILIDERNNYSVRLYVTLLQASNKKKCSSLKYSF